MARNSFSALLNLSRKLDRRTKKAKNKNQEWTTVGSNKVKTLATTVNPHTGFQFTRKEIAELTGFSGAFINATLGPVFKRGRQPLDEKTRQTIVNLRQCGFTLSEIAEIVDVSPATVNRYSYHIGTKVEILTPEDNNVLGDMIARLTPALTTV